MALARKVIGQQKEIESLKKSLEEHESEVQRLQRALAVMSSSPPAAASAPLLLLSCSAAAVPPRRRLAAALIVDVLSSRLFLLVPSLVIFCVLVCTLLPP